MYSGNGNVVQLLYVSGPRCNCWCAVCWCELNHVGVQLCHCGLPGYRLLWSAVWY